MLKYLKLTSVRPCTSIVIEFGVRYLKTKPKLRAADTKADSSGDCAWYSNLIRNISYKVIINYFFF